MSLFNPQVKKKSILENHALCPINLQNEASSPSIKDHKRSLSLKFCDRIKKGEKEKGKDFRLHFKLLQLSNSGFKQPPDMEPPSPVPSLPVK